MVHTDKSYNSLPKALINSIITKDGIIKPQYKFIPNLFMLRRISQESQYKDKKVSEFILLELTGHLFDTHVINKIFDILKILDLKGNIQSITPGNYIIYNYIGKNEKIPSKLIL